MRIGLDGACLSPPLTGVGRYFHGLLSELITLAPEISFILFMKGQDDPGLSFANLRIVKLDGRGGTFYWQNTRLRRAALGAGLDRFWSPNYSLPLLPPATSILTVHDISWRSLPADYPAHVRLYKNITTGRSLRAAALIFTDSDFSRAEIARHAPAATAKLKRVHLGIDDRFRRAADIEIAAFRERYGLGERKIVGFLGSFFGRRHVPELIAALEIARRHDPGLVLVLVGQNYSVPPRLLIGNPSRVVWLPRLPEEEINAFYSALSLFVYLSDYEGFGLPPMEALNCGTPSLLLPRGSLPEIYDGLALFVDRPEPGLVADAIIAFLGREQETRQSLLARWRGRRPYFSWRRAAGECLSAIRGEPCPS